MKPHHRKNISIGTSTAECPACRYKRTTIKGVYVEHLLRSSLRVDQRGRVVGERCKYSGQAAVRVVSYASTREG